MDDAGQRTDPIDALILDAKWKPALKLIENRQKKGDSSDLLQAKKIIIYLKHTDNVRLEQGDKYLKDLIRRKPPFTDIEALKLLDVYFSKHDTYQETISQLWEVAANAQSRDEKFLSGWFLVNLEQERWPTAQKAAMIWQKSFPKKRTPFFLYILCCHLISITPGLEEKDKKLSQMLSFKFLSKAVEDVPPPELGPDPLSPPRAINTEEDLFLLLRVYKDQNKHSEALKILEDPRTGLGSRFAKNSWEVARQMVILYMRCERWQSLIDMCQDILKCAQPEKFPEDRTTASRYNFGHLGDDWIVWDGFITASARLIPTTAGADLKRLIDHFNDFIGRYCEHSASRNAKLASIKFYASDEIFLFYKQLNDAGFESCEVMLLALMSEYFIYGCVKTTCFHDLRPYLPALNPNDRERFLVEAMKVAEEVRPSKGANEHQKMSWITAETNALKIAYYTVVSRDDNLDLPNLLPSFASTCLRLFSVSSEIDFKLPASDRLPGDDAAILCAMALIRMSKLAYKIPAFRSCVFRSILVLEIALSRSKHNYDILLLLIRIYMSLGLGSLAIKRYHQLSIKNLQHVTLAWVLFTRISTIHPHSVTLPGEGTRSLVFDPLDHMISVLNWHTEALDFNLRSIIQLQNNNAWTMELDALGAQDVLRNGFSRPLLSAEAARIRRMRFPEDNQKSNAELIEIPEDVKDTRDRKSFPNYNAAEQLTFEEELPSPGPQSVEPNSKWLVAHLSQARLWAIICGDETKHQIRKPPSAPNEKGDDACSEYEKICFQICDVCNLNVHRISEITQDKAWNSDLESLTCDSLTEIQQEIELIAADSLSQHAKELGAKLPFVHPTWTHLNGLYMRLELCQFVQKTVAFALDREKRGKNLYPSEVKAKLHKISSSCKKLASAVWLDATNYRADCSDPKYLDRMMTWIRGSEDDTLGQEIMALSTRDTDVTQVCASIQESWIDAWDGVIKTKVV